MYLKKLEF